MNWKIFKNKQKQKHAESYKDILITTYRHAMKLYADSGIIFATNPRLEILPVMFILADIAAINSQKDRILACAETDSFISVAISDDFKQDFSDRVDFYGEIVRGRELRCEWLSFNIPENADIIRKITIAYGDILYNSFCADDYDNAPVLMKDMVEQMQFVRFMKEDAEKIFVDLYMSLFNCNDKRLYKNS